MQSKHDRRQVDCLVIDSTPGGLAAAIAGARQGLTTAVVTEDRHVGGMQTSGLGNTNSGQRPTIGGLAAEFHRRVADRYRDDYGEDSPQVRDCDGGFHFEPRIALEVYEHWLAETRVEVVRERFPVAVQRHGARLLAVTLNDGSEIEARWFVDASYEGDLVRLAGCSCVVGRESAAQYGEDLAGLRLPPAARGQADGLTQAYDYRLCLTRDAGNRVPFREPTAYAAANYEDWRQHLRRSAPQSLRQVLPLNMMPNGKTDSRAGEWVGGSHRYPLATRQQRDLIAAAHRRYTQGWLWFLLTDPCIPAACRDELSHWGFAADEFVDNDHWPYHLYVRESSRLVGDWVMTQHDVQSRRFQPDSIGIGSFYLDVHAVRTIASNECPDELVWEGVLGIIPLRAYEIPYRVLLPQQAEVCNLWSVFAVAASHVAFSTLRMEPYFMMMGQAAGTAAAILQAAGGGRAADVPIAELQAQLAADGARLSAAPFADYWPCEP